MKRWATRVPGRRGHPRNGSVAPLGGAGCVRQAPGSGGRTRHGGARISVFKKLLLSFMVLGAVGSTVGAGTFASFTASTTNPGNTFQTGTIVLGQSIKDDEDPVEDPNTETICISTGRVDTKTNVLNTPGDTIEGPAGNDAACGDFFTVDLQKPGGQGTLPDDAVLDITLQNFGNLNATLWLSGLPTCTDDHATPGDLCDAIELTVQEYSDANRTVEKTCHVGGGTVTECAFDAADTLGVLDDAPISLGAMDKFGGDPATSGVEDIRYFRLAVRLMHPDDLFNVNNDINSFQGRNATLGLTWTLQ